MFEVEGLHAGLFTVQPGSWKSNGWLNRQQTHDQGVLPSLTFMVLHYEGLKQAAPQLGYPRGLDPLRDYKNIQYILLKL